MNLLCRCGLHNWRHETRSTPGPIAKATLFYLRFCRRCGRAEIHTRPFMGTPAWLPLEPWPIGPFPDVSVYEKEKFGQASVANLKAWAGNYYRNDPA